MMCINESNLNFSFLKITRYFYDKTRLRYQTLKSKLLSLSALPKNNTVLKIKTD